MPNKEKDLGCILDYIIKTIQNLPIENADEICSILNSSIYNAEDLEALQGKVTLAIGILNTQKALVLDELTLIHKSRKVLSLYQ